MIAPVPPVFADLNVALLSQYANSPVLRALLDDAHDVFDPTPNFDAFYNMIWNIDTAQGFGLDVWGRILGVGRVIQIPSPGGAFLGFDGSDLAHTFGFGVFYGFGSSTDNFPLSDDYYRRLLLAKAAANITDCSIPAINALLTALFPAYAPVYVIDSGGMALIYHFGVTLNVVDYAIVTQTGVLPRPAGVSYTVEQP